MRRLQAIQQRAEVKVINPIPWFPFQRYLRRYKDYHLIPKRETIEGIDVYHPRFLSIPLMFKIVAAFTYAISVMCLAVRLRKHWRYQLLDLHWTFPDLPAAQILSKVFRIKQVVTVRGAAALSNDEWGFRRRIVRWLLPKADYVITLSDKLKQRSIALGVSAKRVGTINNGVDSKLFYYADGREKSRAELDLAQDITIILGVGYLTPGKRFDRIIRALPALMQNRPSIHLFLIGPNGEFAAHGDCAEDLQRVAWDCNVADHVHFVGEVDNVELRKWYNVADYFCLSSRSEGCPNVLMEALACGCPSVATDVGSVSEILQHPFLGVVVPNSEDGVRSGLQTALNTTYNRREIADYMTQFDWNWCADQVLGVFNEVIGQVGTSSAANSDEFGQRESLPDRE